MLMAMGCSESTAAASIGGRLNAQPPIVDYTLPIGSIADCPITQSVRLDCRLPHYQSVRLDCRLPHYPIGPTRLPITHYPSARWPIAPLPNRSDSIADCPITQSVRLDCRLPITHRLDYRLCHYRSRLPIADVFAIADCRLPILDPRRGARQLGS